MDRLQATSEAPTLITGQSEITKSTAFFHTVTAGEQVSAIMDITNLLAS